MDPGYGARYAELYRTHWWWRAREALLERVLDRRIGRGAAGNVLDFGCGDGLFFPVLERYGSPYGIEPETSLLDPAGPWRSRIATGANALDEPDQRRYGLIVALDVLEHIEHPEPIVRELARRLDPGGLLVVTVPAFQSLWTAHDVLNQHVRRYRRAELESLLRGAGLDVINSRYFFVWLAVVKWVVARVERRVPRNPAPPAVPWKPVNAIAYAVSRLEQRALAHVSPPFGSSILLIARAGEMARDA